MSDRQRHREVLGTTNRPCPYCQGGPMMVTRTGKVRRLVDRANPRFDPDVLHHEVCAACHATFLVSENRIRDVLTSRTASAPAMSAVAAPLHDVDDDDDDEHLFLGSAAASRADQETETRAAAEAQAAAEAESRAQAEAEGRAQAEAEAAARTQAEAAARAEEVERVRRRDEARARARTSAVERRRAEAAAKERARAEHRARKAAEAESREQARAQERARKLAELRARERASSEERARRRVNSEARRLAAEQDRIDATPAAPTVSGTGATAEPQARPQPTTALSPAPTVRTTAPWGRADITGPAPEPAPIAYGTSRSVLVGRPAKVGAGRRSGPVRRPAPDRTS